MAEREYEVEFAVTLQVTDRGFKPTADQLRHYLLELAPTLAMRHPAVDLQNVIVEEVDA